MMKWEAEYLRKALDLETENRNRELEAARQEVTLQDIRVVLEKHELAFAGLMGVGRGIVGLLLKDKYGKEPTGFDLPHNYISCSAEVGASKHFGVFYTATLGVFDRLDAGPYQVRSTTNPNGPLILHPWDKVDGTGDKPNDIFILVIMDEFPPVCKLRAWFRGREGQQKHYWKVKHQLNDKKELMDRSHYSISQYENGRPLLHDMSTLPTLEEINATRNKTATGARTITDPDAGFTRG